MPKLLCGLIYINTKKAVNLSIFYSFLPLFWVVGGGGFEPPKSETSDLQSDAFGHSAIRPYIVSYRCFGAGDWNRTRNLLITNQLLCQLSYTSKRQIFVGALGWNRTADIWIFSPPLYRLSYQGIFCFKRLSRRLKQLWRPKTGSNRRPPA